MQTSLIQKFNLLGLHQSSSKNFVKFHLQFL